MKNKVDVQKLYTHAKNVIPGGTNLLSKRPELWVPHEWPNYFRSASKINVIGLDSKKYIDMSTFAVGSCILGYANKKVNSKVINTIKTGNTSTLNSIEDIKLSEELISLHPWAQGTRFARSGGEALAIAIRIARAAAQKTGVVVSGYHGWSDWYLASNLGEDQLGDKGVHLLGLDANGVPPKLINSVKVARLYDIQDIEESCKSIEGGPAAIVTEIQRYSDPPLNFLSNLRKLADRYNAILIFDEVTSGFRFNLGGAHLNYKVNPDICVFAKALGNGFPIAAVVLDEKTFNAAKETFISSTTWSERIGPTAALATIKVMKDIKSWELTRFAGQKIKQIWEENILSSELPANVLSPKNPSIIKLEFEGEFERELKTIWCKLMLGHGYLDNGNFYGTIYHTKKVIDKYQKVVSTVTK
jgi:glutamate-1-semialdehyde 2,1-aminomutase